jgi:hypothetical protein
VQEYLNDRESKDRKLEEVVNVIFRIVSCNTIVFRNFRSLELVTFITCCIAKREKQIYINKLTWVIQSSTF